MRPTAIIASFVAGAVVGAVGMVRFLDSKAVPSTRVSDPVTTPEERRRIDELQR